MHIIPEIDYEKIAQAKNYYTNLGYEYIEVPWIVSHKSYIATRPVDVREFYTLDGYLNASGEQSFIEMQDNDQEITKNCCITPCFRDEKDLDELHHKYFLKLELIDTDVSQENLEKMINDAKIFFEKFIEVEVIKTNDNETSYDIIDKKNGIELGSYGIRNYQNFSWIYGTGLALPRLDTAVNKTK